MPHRNRRLRRDKWSGRRRYFEYRHGATGIVYLDISHMVLEQMEIEFED